MVLRKAVLTATVSMMTLMIPTMALAEGYGKIEVETLNVRQEMTTNSRILVQLSKNNEIKIVNRLLDEQDEEWFEVELQNNKTGYVYAEYVNITKVDGEITDQGVRLRSYPDIEDSEIFKTLDKGDDVVIEYLVEDWYKVDTGSQEGFVHRDYVDVTFIKDIEEKEMEDVERVEKVVVRQAARQTEVREEEPARASEPVREEEPAKEEVVEEEAPVVTSNSGLGAAIVEDAMQFLGNRYVYGGNSLTNGVDCSGFVQQMMKRHGISVTRSSSSQYASDGYKVSKSDLQAGDLLFYGYGSVSHVAIYMGGGQVIHANTSTTGIIISDAFSVGKPYIGAKRVL